MSGRYKAYPEYKDSEIPLLGRMPSHWETNKFRYLFNLGKGLTITKENLQDSGIPCVSYGEVHSKYGFEVDPNIHELKYVDEQYIQSSPSSLLNKGDVIFADTSEDIEGSGNFTQLTSDQTLFAGYHTIIARPSTFNDSRFLAYLLYSPTYRTQIRLAVKGVKVFSITQAILRNTDLWLPPAKAEQQQIANFLDHETAKIDRLISKQQELIELLKEKRQAVISHAVTKGLNPNAPLKPSGVEWLGDVPEHWEIRKIGSFCHYISYGFTNPMPSTDAGPLMLTATDIDFLKIKYDEARRTSQEAFDTLLSLKCKPINGDILITKDGTLGRVAVCDGEQILCISQSIALIRLDQKRVLPEFFAMALCGSDYQSKMVFDAGGTTIKHIYISILAKMEFILPDLEIQRSIISWLNFRLGKIDELIDTSEAASTLLQERRTALISAAVTGKIDVRDWQAPEPCDPETA